MITGPEFFDALLERARAVAQLFGAAVYQVVSQSGEQVTLRPLSSAQGLTDELTLDKAHGLAGTREVCAEGSLVLVTWRGGDSGAPLVIGYLPGVPPVEVEIDAQISILLGRLATLGVARQSDTVTVLLPPATFVGTIGGSPASGMVVWAGQTLGTITTGSAKVKAE